MEQNASIIKDLSESLKELVKKNVSELKDDEAIVFDSPADIDVGSATKLLIYLFQIKENPHLRNTPPSLIQRNDQFFVEKAPLPIDLQYILVPYAKSRETELIIIEKLKLLFYNVPTLRDENLLGNLQHTGNNKINIIPNSPNIHEIHNIWSDFQQKPYKLTLFYLLTPLWIPSLLYQDADLVKEAKFTYLQKGS